MQPPTHPFKKKKLKLSSNQVLSQWFLLHASGLSHTAIG